MENIFGQLSGQMIKQSRDIMFFMDNASLHPENVTEKNNIKIVFLLKNTTSRQQPLDAGIT